MDAHQAKVVAVVGEANDEPMVPLARLARHVLKNMVSAFPRPATAALAGDAAKGGVEPRLLSSWLYIARLDATMRHPAFLAASLLPQLGQGLACLKGLLALKGAAVT